MNKKLFKLNEKINGWKMSKKSKELIKKGGVEIKYRIQKRGYIDYYTAVEHSTYYIQKLQPKYIWFGELVWKDYKALQYCWAGDDHMGKVYFFTLREAQQWIKRMEKIENENAM